MFHELTEAEADEFDKKAAKRWMTKYPAQALQDLIDARVLRYVGYRAPRGTDIHTSGTPEPADELLYVPDPRPSD